MQSLLLIYFLETHEHLWSLILIVEILIFLAAHFLEETYLLLRFAYVYLQYVFQLYILFST
jgi:hypothetical protein